MTLHTLSDQFFGLLVAALSSVLFADVGGFPFIVLWLVAAGVFFTLYLRGASFALLPHAFNIVRGKVPSDTKEAGEVSQFQALCSAIAGTVGLGSIAGISVAVGVGGPGVIFWVLIGGILGMASKYAEVVLSLCYRRIDENGKVYGGPVQYIKHGLRDVGVGWLGAPLALVFASFSLAGAFGGGNMFQSNQTVKVLTTSIPALADYGWVIALVMAVSVFVILLGSIKRVAIVTDKLTPLKGMLYVGCCVVILIVNADKFGEALQLIWSHAFTGDAATGSFIALLALSFKRAFFANEAGLGSAPIAHAAARTQEPVREGAVALIEPLFAATIGILTGLVVVVTGAYQGASLEDGIAIASQAFASVNSWFPLLLAANVVIFAYGCILGWSYYGEMAWSYLFGTKTIRLYQVLFCTCTFLGGIMHFGVVLDFSDLSILGGALPNLIAVFLLRKRIWEETKRYRAKLKA